MVVRFIRFFLCRCDWLQHIWWNNCIYVEIMAPIIYINFWVAHVLRMCCRWYSKKMLFCVRQCICLLLVLRLYICWSWIYMHCKNYVHHVVFVLYNNNYIGNGVSNKNNNELFVWRLCEDRNLVCLSDVTYVVQDVCYVGRLIFLTESLKKKMWNNGLLLFYFSSYSRMCVCWGFAVLGPRLFFLKSIVICCGLLWFVEFSRGLSCVVVVCVVICCGHCNLLWFYIGLALWFVVSCFGVVQFWVGVCGPGSKLWCGVVWCGQPTIKKYK